MTGIRWTINRRGRLFTFSSALLMQLLVRRQSSRWGARRSARQSTAANAYRRCCVASLLHVALKFLPLLQFARDHRIQLCFFVCVATVIIVTEGIAITLAARYIVMGERRHRSLRASRALIVRAAHRSGMAR
jgi:hypothetical protein